MVASPGITAPGPPSEMIVDTPLPPPPPSPRAVADVGVDVPPPPPYTTDRFRDIPSSFQTPESDIHSVNHLHIHNHLGNVIGTYCIDPAMPMPYKSKGKAKWQASPKTPNASFRTRHRASISINLATRGNTTENNKTYVQATTRKGDININLYSLQKGKHINLDVSSRKGRVLVLIPRNFYGAIQLKSRKSAHKVLPALSSASRVLIAKDREMLILVGDPSASSASPGTADDLTTDFCQLGSRKGKVIVGFSGEDKYVPEIGRWQKLGEYLRGGNKSA